MPRNDEPPPRFRAIRTPALLVALAICLGAAGLAAQPPQLRPVVDDSAFGFRLNEERRYVLDPADSLASGEIAEWWISLRSVDREAVPPVAEFEFGHERLELIPGQWNPAQDLMSVRVQGTLVVNLEGFPLRLRFEQRFGSRGETMAGDSLRRTRFWFDGERYRKEIRFGERDWEFDFGVPGFGTVDLEVPRGVFVWLPDALQCLGSSRGTCVESDPAFANPGFLSLAMPSLFEQIDPEGAEKVEREFVFFIPEIIGASPFRPIAPGRWVSRERNQLSNMRRYFAEWKLKLGSSIDVEVGPRTLHSWEIDMGGGIDRIYVEPGGRVVRVDLESTIDNPDDRWIRLQFPFEEFASPNADPAERCCRR